MRPFYSFILLAFSISTKAKATFHGDFFQLKSCENCGKIIKKNNERREMEIKICFVINHEMLPGGCFITKKVVSTLRMFCCPRIIRKEPNYVYVSLLFILSAISQKKLRGVLLIKSGLEKRSGRAGLSSK